MAKCFFNQVCDSDVCVSMFAESNAHAFVNGWKEEVSGDTTPC